MQYVDPRSLFCLVGIAVRIATRLGLHRDGAKVGLSPFETEQRRRLWWQIVVLDKRVAKIIGSASTALALPGTDCQLPLNANDADLHSHAKEAPPAPVGATEMNFCLSRIELTMSGEFQRSPMATNDAGSHHGSSSLFNSNPTSQSSPSRLDRYCAYIESTYLKHCDSKIPIQFFTLMMTRLSLCKLRVVNTMSRDSSNLDPNQRDAAFLAAIQMLEYDNIIHSTDSLRGFRWYTTLEMPVSGYTFLANELRNRATDELCDRAWNAIFENHSHRCLGHNLGRLIYFTIGQMLLKAWNACEEADIRAGRVLPSPELIIFLRQRLPRNFSKETPRSDTIDTSSRLESGMPSGPESGQTGMMLDENLMFSSMNGMNIYEPAFPNYDQLEWTNLIQFGGLSETNFNL